MGNQAKPEDRRYSLGRSDPARPAPCLWTVNFVHLQPCAQTPSLHSRACSRSPLHVPTHKWRISPQLSIRLSLNPDRRSLVQPSLLARQALLRTRSRAQSSRQTLRYPGQSRRRLLTRGASRPQAFQARQRRVLAPTLLLRPQLHLAGRKPPIQATAQCQFMRVLLLHSQFLSRSSSDLRKLLVGLIPLDRIELYVGICSRVTYMRVLMRL